MTREEKLKKIVEKNSIFSENYQFTDLKSIDIVFENCEAYYIPNKDFCN